jgi:hypothetical protein
MMIYFSYESLELPACKVIRPAKSPVCAAGQLKELSSGFRKISNKKIK